MHADDEDEVRLCEPCGHQGEKRPATGSRGMDNAPVCDWHAHRSWSMPARCGQVIKVKVVVDQLCEKPFPCPDHDENEESDESSSGP